MHDTDMIHVVYSIYSLSFMCISEQHTVWIEVCSYFNLLYLIKLNISTHYKLLHLRSYMRREKLYHDQPAVTQDFDSLEE